MFSNRKNRFHNKLHVNLFLKNKITVVQILVNTAIVLPQRAVINAAVQPDIREYIAKLEVLFN